MKFTKSTIEVLKSFSQINPSIVFKPGKILRTLSTSKNVLASANIQEEFPKTVAIYDISRFLGVLNLSGDCEINFGENQFDIVGPKIRTKYTYTSPSLIVSAPDTDPKSPEVKYEVEFPKSSLEKAIRSASLLQLKQLMFSVVEGKVYVTSTDKENSTCDTFSILLADGLDVEDTRDYVDVDVLKVMPRDYTLKVCDRLVQLHSNEDDGLKYWVAASTTNNK